MFLRVLFPYLTGRNRISFEKNDYLVVNSDIKFEVLLSVEVYANKVNKIRERLRTVHEIIQRMLDVPIVIESLKLRLLESKYKRPSYNLTMEGEI